MKHSFAATCLAKGRLLPRLSLRSCDAESGACCGLPEAPVLCGTLRGVLVWARSGPHGRGPLRAAWRIDGRDAPDGRVAPKGCRYARHAVCGARRCGADGSRCSTGSLCVDGVACGVALGGGGVDRGAALRGQRRLGVPLCVDSIAYGGRSGGQRRSGGRRFAEDGLARGAALRGRRRSGCRRATGCRRGRRRDGPIVLGSRLPEGFAQSGVRRASRVESTPGGTHDSAPLPSWGGYRAVRRSVRGYCARPGIRAYRIGFGTPRRGITCGFDIRGASRAGAASAASPSGGRSAT